MEEFKITDYSEMQSTHWKMIFQVTSMYINLHAFSRPQKGEAHRLHYLISVKQTVRARGRKWVLITSGQYTSETEGPSTWVCNVHISCLSTTQAFPVDVAEGVEHRFEPRGSVDEKFLEPKYTCTFQKTQSRSIWPMAVPCQLAR